MECNETTWVTKDGRAIKVKKMTDSHLVNTVNMLLRQAKTAHDAVILEAECFLATLSGDMAQMAMEHELDMLYNMEKWEFLNYSCPTWDALWKEIDKRNLNDRIKYTDYYAGDDTSTS